MKFIEDIHNLDNLRSIVTQDLKEYGIKVPKAKKSKTKEDLTDLGDYVVFGNSLTQVPCLLIDGCGPVPRFIVEATALLEKNIDVEGLFRKSGACSRQKELKERIELGEELKDANPLDVASLIKQFFRELPDPLLSFRLHDCFLKCYQLENETARCDALLLLCLMLPWHNISTLRFFTQFMAKVASHCENNKMDVQNLSVCLAPNLLYTPEISDKISQSENLLQMHTGIIQLLIGLSEELGLVSDSLADRATLLACLQSEDELDRTSEGLDESRPKKKKKRSGSLHGLVSNLSNSFTKWRKEGRHNSSSVSDKSSILSVTSTDTIDASMHRMHNPYMVTDIEPVDAQSIMLSDATPKVMRKRKYSGEVIPFSASKKKAILQHMPNSLALGSTPFTPMQKKKDGSTNDVVFSATPTPRKKIDMTLASPGSTSKSKRSNAGKSGCFTPNKSLTKKKSVKGFFRRLSGGKSSDQSGLESDAVGLRLGGSRPEGAIIIQPDSSTKRRSGGIFSSKRHRKTPSSPARILIKKVSDPLLTPRAAEAGGVEKQGLTPKHSLSNMELANMLQQDLQMVTPKQRQRGYSSDGVPIGNRSLTRGRPNTVQTGLPNARYQQSPDHRRMEMSLPPLRHSSQRDISQSDSPERRSVKSGIIDTSPIAKTDMLVHDMSPVRGDGEAFRMHEVEEDDVLSVNEAPVEVFKNDGCEENMSVEKDDKSASDEVDSRGSGSENLSKQTSSSSMSLEESMHQQGEGLDRAFIHDLHDHSMAPEPSKEVDKVEVQAKTDVISEGASRGNDDVMQAFKVPEPEEEDAVTRLRNKVARHQSFLKETTNPVRLQKRQADNRKKLADPKLQKSWYMWSPSMNHRSSIFVTSDMHQLLTRVGVVGDKHMATPFTSLEVDENGKSPNENVLNLQKAAGRINTTAKEDACGTSDGVKCQENKELSSRHASPLRFANSVSRRAGASPVRIPTIFAKADREEAEKYRNLARSALIAKSPAKPAIVNRARHPRLPISTNLVNAPVVENIKQKLGSVCEEDSKQPTECTPVKSVCQAKLIDDTAGRTPVQLRNDSSLQSVDIASEKTNTDRLSTPSNKHPLKDSTNTTPEKISSTTTTTTPKIKAGILPDTHKLLGSAMKLKPTSPAKKCRSPVKPVKRLKGSSPSSPRSPRRIPKSPKKTYIVKRGGLSPIPNHVSDWNF